MRPPLRRANIPRTGDRTERGAALVWVAGMMVALLAVSALAVDVGWYYLNGSRLQRAADSAALAGVVYLPSFPGKADTEAQAAASANEFGAAAFAGLPNGDNRYTVTLGIDVPMFFASVVGLDTLPLSRSATAEYVEPVAMGSPASCFGVGGNWVLSQPGASSISSASRTDCASYNQNFWASIQNPYTQKQSGDPYAVVCLDMPAGGPGCSSANPEHRPAGYNYGVEHRTAGASLEVWGFDGGYYDRGSLSSETGDARPNPKPAPAAGAVTTFELKGVDATPFDPNDNPSLGCVESVTAETGGWKNKWRRICRVTSAPAGTYVLNVKSSGPGGGLNQYSLIAESSGATPRIFAIDDMSIFTNKSSGVARIYLAEIAQLHRGKKLELRFFDPGESDQTSYMTVRRPDGSIPSCKWTAEDRSGSTTRNGNGSCSIKTTQNSTALFNEQWITAYIDIPPTYTCTSNCYWTVDLDLHDAHDRTTWGARVIGNPVRLVPNP